ncbi:MAG: HAAS signaling domain-containing protein [Cellulomonas sp.]
MTDSAHLVTRYLDELDHLLTHADPDERADVLASVREHIEAALAEQTAQGRTPDVAVVLAGLGSPEQVAGEVRGRAPGDIGWVGTPGVVALGAQGGAAGLSAAWVPPVACLLLLIGGLGGFLIFPLVLWLGGAILLVASPLWRTREKILGVVLSPVGGLVALVATVAFVLPVCTTMVDGNGTVESQSGSCGTGVHVAAWVGLSLLALLVVFAIGYVVVLWRRGAARAERLSAPVTAG